MNAASPAGAQDPGIALVSGPVRILLVSGSTRAGSTNTAALRTLRALAAPPVTAVLYDEMAVADARFRAAAAEVLRAVAITSAAARPDPERPRPATAGHRARSFW